MQIVNCKLQIEKKGFTLIEIFLIIGIIGVIVLIGLPTFKAFQPNLELSEATQELITNLRYAQQLSVTEQTEHGVRFDTLSNTYQIIKYGAGEEILKEKEFPDKVSFQEVSGFTNNEVKFNPYGAVKEAGIITLINTKNTTTTIEVRPSGFVKTTK